MVELRQLAYFVAVVEAKSFTAAAEVLHIAQPALSQHMQRLEQDIGNQLLHRHSRGIEPTPAGRRLLEHARQILISVEAARADVRSLEEQQTCLVRLGMPRSLCDLIGVELMTAWRGERPNIRLQIVEQLSSTLTEWVQAGRLDLAVTAYPADVSSLSHEPLLQEKMCAVVPADATHAVPSEVEFSELAHQTIIAPSAAYASRQILDVTAKYSSTPLIIGYEIDSVDLEVSLVEAKLGWAIQPYLTALKYARAGRVLPRLIVKPGMTRRVNLVYASNRILSDAENEVRKALKHQLRTKLEDRALQSFVELDFSDGDEMASSTERNLPTEH